MEAAGAGSTHPPLRRSRSDRIFFGVCGGLAEHLGVDPMLVRIGAVLVLAFGGVGVLAYLAAVLLVPDEGSDVPPLRMPGGRWLRVLGALLLVVAVGGGLRSLFGASSPWFPVPLLLLGVALLAVSARHADLPSAGAEPARRPVGVVAAGAALVAGGVLGVLAAAGALHLGFGAMLAALVIVAGAVLAVSSFWGRPRGLLVLGMLLVGAASLASAADLHLSGAIGRSVIRPVNVAAPRYRLAVGDLQLDLRQLQPRAGGQFVTARVGVGRLQIVVPRTSQTTIDGEPVGGDVHRHGGVGVSSDILITGATGQVRIHAHVGVGVIEVAPRGPGQAVGG